jgi:hypothetical protein
VAAIRSQPEGQKSSGLQDKTLRICILEPALCQWPVNALAGEVGTKSNMSGYPANRPLNTGVYTSVKIEAVRQMDAKIGHYA